MKYMENALKEKIPQLNFEEIFKKIDNFVDKCLKGGDNRFSNQELENLLKGVPKDSDEYLFLSSLAESLYFIKLFADAHKLCKNDIIDIAQWQHKILKLLADSNDPQLITSFWIKFNQIVDFYKRKVWLNGEQQQRLNKKISAVQQGLIGEIGFYRALKNFGLNPKISDVEQDVNIGADIIIRQNHVVTLVQIKCTKQEEGIKVYDANDHKNFNYFNTNEVWDKRRDVDDRIRSALELLGQVCYDKKAQNPQNSGVNFRGLVVVVPASFFNQTTAYSEKEKLPLIRQALKQYFPELG